MAQKESLEQVDKKLAQYFQQIEYWNNADHRYDEHKDDSIWAINKLLMPYLEKSLTEHPESISYPFTKAKSGKYSSLEIVTSDDGNMRFYCWDTETGGTMRFYANLIQYKENGKVKVSIINDVVKNKDNPDGGTRYDSVFTIHTNSGKTIYLAKSYSNESSAIGIVSLDALEINNGKLKDAFIFKTSKKLLSDINYEYYYTTTYDIHLSTDKKTLYIPIVIDMKVTNRNLAYRFNGEQFVYDKNAKN